MRKFLAALVVLTLVASYEDCAVASTPIVALGKTCNKPGTIQSSGKTKLQCVTAGSKTAVWKTYAPTSALGQPGSSTPLTFSNLYVNRKTVAVTAWTQITNALKTSLKMMPTIDVYRGPNTPQYVKDPASVLGILAHLYPQAAYPKRIVILYWSHSDIAWAVTKAQNLMGPVDYAAQQDQTGGPFVDCYTATSCKVGHAYVASDGTAYMGIGVPDSLPASDNDSPWIPLGSLEGSEFYHALQIYPYFLNHSVISTSQNKMSMNFVPMWLAFGSENFTLSALRFASNESGFEASMISTYWINSAIPGFSASWLHDYLDAKNVGNVWSDDGYATSGINVCMGQGLMEILIAIKGTSVSTDIPALMSEGKSFTDAFQEEFGTSWQDAEPEIEKVLYDKYQNKY